MRRGVSGAPPRADREISNLRFPIDPEGMAHQEGGQGVHPVISTESLMRYNRGHDHTEPATTERTPARLLPALRIVSRPGRQGGVAGLCVRELLRVPGRSPFRAGSLARPGRPLPGAPGEDFGTAQEEAATEAVDRGPRGDEGGTGGEPGEDGSTFRLKTLWSVAF